MQGIGCVHFLHIERVDKLCRRRPIVLSTRTFSARDRVRRPFSTTAPLVRWHPNSCPLVAISAYHVADLLSARACVSAPRDQGRLYALTSSLSILATHTLTHSLRPHSLTLTPHARTDSPPSRHTHSPPTRHTPACTQRPERSERPRRPRRLQQLQRPRLSKRA